MRITERDGAGHAGCGCGGRSEAFKSARSSRSAEAEGCATSRRPSEQFRPWPTEAPRSQGERREQHRAVKKPAIHVTGERSQSISVLKYERRGGLGFARCGPCASCNLGYAGRGRRFARDELAGKWGDSRSQRSEVRQMTNYKCLMTNDICNAAWSKVAGAFVKSSGYCRRRQGDNGCGWVLKF